MPRPDTKEGLLEAMQKEHDALLKQLKTLPDSEMTTVSSTTGWSIKDVLAHLSEWEQMCLGWYQSDLSGETPSVPAEGYKWGQLPALNQHILEKHRQRPLDEILEWFHTSYRHIQETVQEIPEEDLFTPGRYAWTRQNKMAAYFNGSTSSHYAWARKEVRKILKG